MDAWREEEVSEFQRLWQEEFGETISAEFARKRLTEVVALLTFLAEWSVCDATEPPPTLSDEVPPLLPQVE
jgi:hypothetical protein